MVHQTISLAHGVLSYSFPHFVKIFFFCVGKIIKLSKKSSPSHSFQKPYSVWDTCCSIPIMKSVRFFKKVALKRLLF
ncbi:hypothetical protein LEP1GSC038_3939 [Leptospira weilii str. 2006001855]|uniref:Uncharacterized protein n=1 Tax=Leptospira weilii str. 2006001855 TaxID=996804 RepID=M6FID2_9LEPT|nr:hypothetical protein LEP1GSC038_3939 [Leptospira weilii str. 2006001855]